MPQLTLAQGSAQVLSQFYPVPLLVRSAAPDMDLPEREIAVACLSMVSTVPECTPALLSCKSSPMQVPKWLLPHVCNAYIDSDRQARGLPPRVRIPKAASRPAAESNRSQRLASKVSGGDRPATPSEANPPAQACAVDASSPTGSGRLMGETPAAAARSRVPKTRPEVRPRLGKSLAKLMKPGPTVFKFGAAGEAGAMPMRLPTSLQDNDSDSSDAGAAVGGYSSTSATIAGGQAGDAHVSGAGRTAAQALAADNAHASDSEDCQADEKAAKLEQWFMARPRGAIEVLCLAAREVHSECQAAVAALCRLAAAPSSHATLIRYGILPLLATHSRAVDSHLRLHCAVAAFHLSSTSGHAVPMYKAESQAVEKVLRDWHERPVATLQKYWKPSAVPSTPGSSRPGSAPRSMTPSGASFRSAALNEPSLQDVRVAISTNVDAVVKAVHTDALTRAAQREVQLVQCGLGNAITVGSVFRSDDVVTKSLAAGTLYNIAVTPAARGYLLQDGVLWALLRLAQDADLQLHSMACRDMDAAAAALGLVPVARSRAGAGKLHVGSAEASPSRSQAAQSPALLLQLQQAQQQSSLLLTPSSDRLTVTFMRKEKRGVPNSARSSDRGSLAGTSRTASVTHADDSDDSDSEHASGDVPLCVAVTGGASASQAVLQRLTRLLHELWAQATIDGRRQQLRSPKLRVLRGSGLRLQLDAFALLPSISVIAQADGSADQQLGAAEWCAQAQQWRSGSADQLMTQVLQHPNSRLQRGNAAFINAGLSMELRLPAGQSKLVAHAGVEQPSAASPGAVFPPSSQLQHQQDSTLALVQDSACQVLLPVQFGACLATTVAEQQLLRGQLSGDLIGNHSFCQRVACRLLHNLLADAALQQPVPGTPAGAVSAESKTGAKPFWALEPGALRDGPAAGTLELSSAEVLAAASDKKTLDVLVAMAGSSAPEVRQQAIACLTVLVCRAESEAHFAHSGVLSALWECMSAPTAPMIVAALFLYHRLAQSDAAAAIAGSGLAWLMLRKAAGFLDLAVQALGSRHTADDRALLLSTLLGMPVKAKAAPQAAAALLCHVARALDLAWSSVHHLSLALADGDRALANGALVLVEHLLGLTCTVCTCRQWEGLGSAMSHAPSADLPVQTVLGALREPVALYQPPSQAALQNGALLYAVHALHAVCAAAPSLQVNAKLAGHDELLGKSTASAVAPAVKPVGGAVAAAGGPTATGAPDQPPDIGDSGAASGETSSSYARSLRVWHKHAAGVALACCALCLQNRDWLPSWMPLPAVAAVLDSDSRAGHMHVSAGTVQSTVPAALAGLAMLARHAHVGAALVDPALSANLAKLASPDTLPASLQVDAQGLPTPGNLPCQHGTAGAAEPALGMSTLSSVRSAGLEPTPGVTVPVPLIAVPDLAAQLLVLCSMCSTDKPLHISVVCALTDVLRECAAVWPGLGRWVAAETVVAGAQLLAAEAGLRYSHATRLSILQLLEARSASVLSDDAGAVRDAVARQLLPWYASGAMAAIAVCAELSLALCESLAQHASEWRPLEFAALRPPGERALAALANSRGAVQAPGFDVASAARPARAWVAAMYGVTGSCTALPTLPGVCGAQSTSAPRSNPSGRWMPGLFLPQDEAAGSHDAPLPRHVYALWQTATAARARAARAYCEAVAQLCARVLTAAALCDQPARSALARWAVVDCAGDARAVREAISGLPAELPVNSLLVMHAPHAAIATAMRTCHLPALLQLAKCADAAAKTAERHTALPANALGKVAEALISDEARSTLYAVHGPSASVLRELTQSNALPCIKPSRALLAYARHRRMGCSDGVVDLALRAISNLCHTEVSRRSLIIDYAVPLLAALVRAPDVSAAGAGYAAEALEHLGEDEQVQRPSGNHSQAVKTVLLLLPGPETGDVLPSDTRLSQNKALAPAHLHELMSVGRHAGDAQHSGSEQGEDEDESDVDVLESSSVDDFSGPGMQASMSESKSMASVASPSGSSARAKSPVHGAQSFGTPGVVNWLRLALGLPAKPSSSKHTVSHAAALESCAILRLAEAHATAALPGEWRAGQPVPRMTTCGWAAAPVLQVQVCPEPGTARVRVQTLRGVVQCVPAAASAESPWLALKWLPDSAEVGASAASASVLQEHSSCPGMLVERTLCAPWLKIQRMPRAIASAATDVANKPKPQAHQHQLELPGFSSMDHALHVGHRCGSPTSASGGASARSADSLQLIATRGGGAAGLSKPRLYLPAGENLQSTTLLGDSGDSGCDSDLSESMPGRLRQMGRSLKYSGSGTIGLEEVHYLGAHAQRDHDMEYDAEPFWPAPAGMEPGDAESRGSLSARRVVQAGKAAHRIAQSPAVQRAAAQLGLSSVLANRKAHQNALLRDMSDKNIVAALELGIALAARPHLDDMGMDNESGLYTRAMSKPGEDAADRGTKLGTAGDVLTLTLDGPLGEEARQAAEAKRSAGEPTAAQQYEPWWERQTKPIPTRRQARAAREALSTAASQRSASPGPLRTTSAQQSSTAGTQESKRSGTAQSSRPGSGEAAEEAAPAPVPSVFERMQAADQQTAAAKVARRQREREAEQKQEADALQKMAAALQRPSKQQLLAMTRRAQQREADAKEQRLRASLKRQSSAGAAAAAGQPVDGPALRAGARPDAAQAAGRATRPSATSRASRHSKPSVSAWTADRPNTAGGGLSAAAEHAEDEQAGGPVSMAQLAQRARGDVRGPRRAQPRRNLSPLRHSQSTSHMLQGALPSAALGSGPGAPSKLSKSTSAVQLNTKPRVSRKQREREHLLATLQNEVPPIRQGGVQAALAFSPLQGDAAMAEKRKAAKTAAQIEELKASSAAYKERMALARRRREHIAVMKARIARRAELAAARPSVEAQAAMDSSMQGCGSDEGEATVPPFPSGRGGQLSPLNARPTSSHSACSALSRPVEPWETAHLNPAERSMLDEQAETIQRGWRRQRERRAQCRAATAMQCAWRAHCARQETGQRRQAAREHRAVVTMQCAWRSSHARAKAGQLRYARDHIEAEAAAALRRQREQARAEEKQARAARKEERRRKREAKRKGLPYNPNIGSGTLGDDAEGGSAAANSVRDDRERGGGSLRKMPSMHSDAGSSRGLDAGFSSAQADSPAHAAGDKPIRVVLSKSHSSSATAEMQTLAKADSLSGSGTTERRSAPSVGSRTPQAGPLSSHTFQLMPSPAGTRPGAGASPQLQLPPTPSAASEAGSKSGKVFVPVRMADGRVGYMPMTPQQAAALRAKQLSSSGNSTQVSSMNFAEHRPRATSPHDRPASGGSGAHAAALAYQRALIRSRESSRSSSRGGPRDINMPPSR